jgi:hypothetical protein
MDKVDKAERKVDDGRTEVGTVCSSSVHMIRRLWSRIG